MVKGAPLLSRASAAVGVTAPKPCLPGGRRVRREYQAVLQRPSDGGEPGAPALLHEAVAGLRLPAGDGYAWVAAEAATAKGLRQHLVEERGLSKDRVKAAAYWKRGAAAVHETYND